MDWNNDGKLDILSGCYWTNDSDAGHIQMLAGNGTLEFAAAMNVTNADGEPLRNAKVEGGVNDPNQTKTICTQQHAVDYDADGDLDLVVGCFAEYFFLYKNEGQDGQHALAAPIELPVQSTSHHAAPHLVDWDNDGDLDLLSGTASGGAIWSQNIGTRTEPKWDEFVELIPPANRFEQSTSGGQTIQPSRATRVWATDWNRDGSLDLLVGDSARIVKRQEGVDEEAFQKFQAVYNDAMTEYLEKRAPLVDKYRKLVAKGLTRKDSELKELVEQLRSLSKNVNKLRAEKAKFQTERSTGFVWLYLRKPDSSTDLTQTIR